MTRSNPRKGKHERNTEMTCDDDMEGTSARTRPFSFDEIMLARKNKADATKQVISGPVSTDITLVHEGKIVPPESHKKTNEDFDIKDTKNTYEDFQKATSLRKGDTNTSKGNNKLDPDNDKGSQEHYPKLKSVVDKNISNDRVAEVRKERRYSYNREKRAGEKDGFLGDHNGSERRQYRSSVKKEKGSETIRGKSEMDRKQLYTDDMWVSRKRKTDGHTISDSGFKKRNERDMMLLDKLSNRGKDRSGKEVRHRHHDDDDKTQGRSAGEKHGSEKKEKKPTRAYHGESKSKRRRSPSIEHIKESQSPKAHKHKRKDKREHEELPPNSTQDRSGKENSDADKRISNNGSSNQYRRNNASSSGLGGYSPRKRKTDAAAKTPSPTRRSPARRSAGWDLQPVEKEGVISGSTFADVHMSQSQGQSLSLSMSIQDSPSGTPLVPIVMKPIGISPHTLSSQMHAIESIQLTQATRPMRRLYVENLPASASEKDLIECINKFLLSSGVNYIQGTQPCISCIIHKEKGQALLEFLTPEDASMALSFDGISFSGSNLKFRRPKDYYTISTGVPDKSMAAFDSVSDNIEDSPHKIFIGGISKFISSKMLLEIARAFGPVKAYRYEYVAGMNEPCAFLEFVDHSVTSKACAGLNGMRLGGKVVTAVFATPDATTGDVAKSPFYGIPEHAKPLLEKPSAVLQLKNVLDHRDLLALSDSELEEILEDIRIECSRFGTVKSINVAKLTNTPGTKKADGCDLMPENRSSEIEKSRDTINEVPVLNQRGPAENYNCDDNAGISNPSTGQEDAGMSAVVDSLPHEISAVNPIEEEIGKSASDVSGVLEKNDNLSEEDSKVEENSPRDGGPVEQDTNERRKIDSSEVDTNMDAPNDPGNLFEPGCVFVEYRRAEAACTAAHCLHERLFDGRVVTVEYVSPDVYHSRFRK
ncbi:splicing factor U2af large subunit A [Andrographis paniculata]|uniref:splicing factor U2af large subunit A n=1 Tax=Andrographis paniculata TaxID=175694 RepID=UPI0021E7B2BD|nr:splicing factor U2af large subunit A [Andrographis paniculata]